MSELSSLRILGVRYIAATCCLSAITAVVWSVYTGALILGMAAAAIAVLPAYFGAIGRNDTAARLTLGATFPLFAAIFVALSKGSGWVIDMHLVFFAFLAMIAIMADWRAVAASAVVVAVHHLALNSIAPFYVFPDGSDFGRVGFHAVVLVIEAVTLGLLCQRLEALCLANAEARAQQAAEEAERQRMQDQIQAEQNVVLKGLERQLQALSDGNLVARIKSTFPGEYDKARQSLNETCESLRQIVSTVASTSEQVGEGARQIKEASQSLADTSERQAIAIEKVSSTAEHVLGDFEKNAALWREAQTSAVEARTKADQGGSVIESAAAAINRIKDSSKEISEMVALIDSIAFQTNLLALNAGVEAARAGESGKGFAVVANEVRELAQRSGESAASIKDLISRSNAEVKEGVEQVGQMVGLLEEVVSRIAHISDKIDHLAQGSEGSLQGVRDIRQAIGSLEGTMQHIAAMSEETSASSVQLASGASEMRRSIAHFSYESEEDQLKAMTNRAIAA